MQVLGVKTDDFDLFELLPSKKHASKKKVEASDPLAVKAQKQKKITKKLKVEPPVNDPDENSTLDEEAALCRQLDDMEHKCQHCGKCFSVRSRLTAHLVAHTKERPFECKDCGIVKIRQKNLLKSFHY